MLLNHFNDYRTTANRREIWWQYNQCGCGDSARGSCNHRNGHCGKRIETEWQLDATFLPAGALPATRHVQLVLQRLRAVLRC
jgi:hypothetical protein